MNLPKQFRLLIYIIPFLLIQTIASCQDEKFEITDFFDDLTTNIPEEKLKLFTSKKLDSAGTTIDLVRDDIRSELSKEPKNLILEEYLDSLLIKNNDTRTMYLSIGLHLYLNKLDVNHKVITNECNKISEYEWQEYSLKVDNEKIRIAEINDSLFDLGDTIKVFLKVSKFLGKITTTYHGGFTTEEDKADTINSIEIIGVIVDKDFESIYPEGVDTNSIIFRLNVLGLSKKDVLLSSEKIEVGDNWDFYVTAYGGLIDPVD